MDKIGVLPPEQMREMWQWYQSQKQLPAQLTKNFPQRRPIDEVSPHRVFVKNTESEAIPPFACMRIIGVALSGQRTVITVEKPTSRDGEFLFNGPYQIDAAADAVPATEETDAVPAKLGVGWAYRFGVVVMLGATPSAPNVSYQPILNSWEVEEGGGPFTVFGEYKITPESETAALIGRFGSAGGGGHTMWFTIVDVHCPDDYDPDWYLRVTPLWYTGDCGKVPPGQDADGYWHFYTVCGHDSDQVDTDLPGTLGYGTYFFPYNSETCDPRWLISDLCAIPECS